MKRKKLLFVYNPFSGKGQIKHKLSEITDQFVKSGYEVTIYPTQKPQDAMELVEQAEDVYALVVCSGGDGTLDETVTGMMKREKKVPIGYIPAGSTNDFANSLDIPKSMEQAARIAVEGEPFGCDIGSFNGDYFVYIAAFGLFTDVSYATSQELKNRIGHLAYLLEGVKRIPGIQSYHLQVTCEGQTFEDEFIYGMVTNSTSAGGFKNITGKHVELDDGLFEVTLIRMPRNPIELNNIVLALLNRDIDTNAMYCFRTARLVLESTEPVAWTLDGEYGGKPQSVCIRNLHREMEIMVKAEVLPA